MDTETFLRTVWPAEGPYCLHLFHPKEDGERIKMNRGFDTVEEVLSYVDRVKDTDDVYFTVHAIKTKLKANPDRPGKFKTFRTHDNMRESCAFFFDLDVGEREEGKSYKYPTQEAAWEALERFLFNSALPYPTVVSSGGGLHVYWMLDEPIESAAWRTPADKLHALAKKLGLRPDPARTTDQSSVLRIPGTYNHKTGSKRPVSVIMVGPVSETEAFLTQLDELSDHYGYEPQQYIAAPDYVSSGGNLDRTWDGAVISADDIAAHCAHVAHFRDSGGDVPEPYWYSMIGLIKWAHDGREKLHEWSSGYDGYDAAETDHKIDQWGRKFPTTCAKLEQVCGAAECAACPLKGTGKSPIAIATQALKQELLPAPEIEETPAAAAVPRAEVGALAEPPWPYSRRQGGIYREKSAKELDDEEGDGKAFELVLPYDLFPVDIYDKSTTDDAFSTWCIRLPFKGQKLFDVKLSTLGDGRALKTCLTENQVFHAPSAAQKVHMYMVAYIQQLQKHKSSHKQYDHLGFATDEDTQAEKFILYGKRIDVASGAVEPAAMSRSTQHAAAWFKSKGLRDVSRRMLDFYNKPGYEPHQFGVLAGFAAPFMKITGQHGVVINFNGDSGASKSTLLYLIASLYGQPKSYVINGTPGGTTANAREDRAMMFANLPVLVDEITLMQDFEARNMVFIGTQPTGKETMRPDRTMRPHRGGMKATLMLTTSNSSLHQLINTNNTAGQAGSVRVFEIEIDKKLIPDTKATADRFIQDLDKHYGHLGEEFLRTALPYMDDITEAYLKRQEKIDADLGLEADKRFWSLAAALILTIGNFTKKMGLHSYDMARIKEWLYTVQFPRMIAQLKSEKDRRNPTTVLTDYMSQINGNTVHVERDTTGNLGGYVSIPHSALLAHHHWNGVDNELWVLLNPFLKHCQREGHNFRELMHKLVTDKIIINPDCRRQLGQGTSIAGSRSHCFIVNLNHPRLKGRVPVQAPQQPQQPAPSNVVPLRPQAARKAP